MQCGPGGGACNKRLKRRRQLSSAAVKSLLSCCAVKWPVCGYYICCCCKNANTQTQAYIYTAVHSCAAAVSCIVRLVRLVRISQFFVVVVACEQTFHFMHKICSCNSLVAAAVGRGSIFVSTHNGQVMSDLRLRWKVCYDYMQTLVQHAFMSLQLLNARYYYYWGLLLGKIK